MIHASQQKRVWTLGSIQAFPGQQARTRGRALEERPQEGGIVRLNLFGVAHWPMGAQRVVLPAVLRPGREGHHNNHLVQAKEGQ